MKIIKIEDAQEKSRICEKVLRSLPGWFGIESAIINYTKDVQKLETWIAVDSDVVGFISVSKHNPTTAEIHVMGIMPEYHGKKIGNRLLWTIEKSLGLESFKFLIVKTLSEARTNEEYDRTRRFYLRAGFAPLEEFKTLWGKTNPCLLLCKTIASDKENSRTIATDFTLQFVKKFIPEPSKILEVGCGLGHLAEQLLRLGHSVLGIDTSETAIESTIEKGVHAKKIQIEALQDTCFGAVLFTRSIHHIHPMDSCLDRAKELLKLGGTVLVEDFGYDLINEDTAGWYQGLRNALAAIAKKEEWIAPQSESLTHWMKDHSADHKLHKAQEIEAEIRRRFKKVHVQRNLPYLFRYFAGVDHIPVETVQAIFLWEEKLIAEGKIKGIGLRLVGSN